jgi:acetolactate synthase-1/2/3 large subunit
MGYDGVKRIETGLVDGGTLFGQALANEGIEKGFCLVGGHITPILHGMRRTGIEITATRHECSAMYAAIACARATGKPVAVVTTAGPGVTNTVSGMIEAIGCKMPIIHIGGAVPVNGLNTGEHMDSPTLEVQRSCSKWAQRITSIRVIPYYVSLALRHAMEGTPGPVYIEAPQDFVYGTIDMEKVRFPVNPRANTIPSGDLAAIESVAELLVNAKQPAAIVGDGARFNIGDYAKDIAELSDYLKMPLSTRRACKGLFGSEYENPLLRTFGLRQADVVLSMGMRWDWTIGFGSMIPADAKVIQIHTDAKEIGFNLRADIGIIGGTGPVVSQILQEIKKKRDKPVEKCWNDIPKGLPVDRVPDKYRAKDIPIHPPRLAWEVAKFLSDEGRDWNFAIDGGEISVHMGESGAVIADRPGQLHGAGPSGMIGTGTPMLLGAWVANRKPCLLLTGDGSFGFYGMELETMERLGVPAVVVISNDSAWGMIRLLEEHNTPEEVEVRGHLGTELFDQGGKIRAYEKLVSMWGGHGELVTDPEEIIPAIKRAAANGKASIVNVQVDREVLSSWTQGAADARTRREKNK